MDFSKLHFYALIFLALGFAAGFIVSSFHGGEPEPAIRVWLVVVAIYIPFYVLRSEYRGHLHIPGKFGGYDFYKAKSKALFRAAQGFCLLVAVLLLVWTV